MFQKAHTDGIKITSDQQMCLDHWRCHKQLLWAVLHFYWFSSMINALQIILLNSEAFLSFLSSF